jgi:hypothetical protein
VDTIKLLAGLGIALAACSSRSSQNDAAGGEGGAPVGVTTSEGGSGATEPAGAGGEAGLDADKLRDATEHGLAMEDVVTDPTELDGKSFTLTGSLCPSESWPALIGGGFDHGLDSMRGFSLRLSEAGELELVSFTRAQHDIEAWPRVQATPLTSAGLGFDASDVHTCARESYFFEDEYQVEEYRAAHLHVVFTRGRAGELSAQLAATTPRAAPAVSPAEADTTAPEVLRASDLPMQYLAELWLQSPLENAFVLSEPVTMDSRVELFDRDGAAVAVEPVLDAGFVVGFFVRDALSNAAHFDLELRDAAGNTSMVTGAYPGVSWPSVHGDFEGDVSLETAESLDPYDHEGCGATLVQGLDGVPAIAGKQSLVVEGRASCRVFLRVARAAGASTLLFDARQMHYVDASAAPLRVLLHSLAAGGDGFVVDDGSSWAKDAQLSTADYEVSVVQTISVALPARADDFVLELQPENDLMLDSLRFE